MWLHLGTKLLRRLAPGQNGTREVTPELDTERVEHASRAFDGDAVVLVSLVSRHLRLVHTELFGQLALGHWG